jgi:hypothetical protein
MDWIKGKSTRSHGFSHKMVGVPVIFPLNKSIDLYPLALPQCSAQFISLGPPSTMEFDDFTHPFLG